MRINHNIVMNNTHREIVVEHGRKNTKEISSGPQINHVGDDEVGLAISKKLRGQIKGLEISVKSFKAESSSKELRFH
ncbi:hypothetical protein PJ311_14850 [Bacillus sp. CLL-7-23]|uniref:Flagellin N-terminal domain-containing protein n=1 Tax=Bacillus changyiensis TaxID=3004103 RepID=A0ABT4X6D9_9BACI|nr:hypothetical protein [Bacillus changyiensis]MDA7027856.1 hypothetical protein [Bacillus changyiensis]